MALDFMAAKSQRKAGSSPLVYSMPEAEHATLMGLAGPDRKYPLLHKFSDYYQDAVIVSDKIAPLLQELQGLKDLNPGQVPDISIFLQFLHQAQQEQDDIYIFCD